LYVREAYGAAAAMSFDAVLEVWSNVGSGLAMISKSLFVSGLLFATSASASVEVVVECRTLGLCIVEKSIDIPCL